MELAQYEFAGFMGINTLVVLFSVPLVLGRVPRNLFYGFRTPKTLSSDAVWYPANRILGRAMIIAGLFGMMMGLLSKFLAMPMAPGRIITFFCVVPIVIAGLYAFWHARHLPVRASRHDGPTQ